jgi:hypothetical protein
MHMHRTTLTAVAAALSVFVIGLTGRPASAQMMAKAQVANLIAKVENGVDEFKNYLEKRGDNAREASSTAQATGRKKRQATESQKASAGSKKDALDDALGELNRSTNRLRRKFDPTDKWMETKAQVEKVVDDGRKINQVVARGSYGPDAARLWGVLRTGINDLARAYGVPPMGI